MTPNKLAVYFVADMVLADMVVADIDFPCGRYGFLLWPIIVLLWPIWLWPIWFVADMVAPPLYGGARRRIRQMRAVQLVGV